MARGQAIGKFFRNGTFKQSVVGTYSSGDLVVLALVEQQSVEVGGMPRVQEVAFVHHPSRTLLLADLCFNVRSAPNLFTRLFMKLNGAWGHFGPSRVARGYMKDRAAVRASVDRLLAHDFDRVVVAHGDVLETGGRAELERAFAFLRG